MRRLWIGIVLLAVMLAGGIGMLLFSRDFYEDFSAALQQASDAAQAGDWAQAGALTEKATAQWKHHQHFLASFTDHEPVEEVSMLLSRLELFRNARLTVDFADTCQSLCHLCEAIDESHSLKWWSLLSFTITNYK